MRLTLTFCGAPPPMIDRADDSLAAVIDGDVLHLDGLLTRGSVFLQGFNLSSKCAGQLVEHVRGRVLLFDGVDMGEMEDLCSIKKDRLMKTDWNLVRAMMQAAIDTCEQLETLGTGNRIGPPRSRLQANEFPSLTFSRARGLGWKTTHTSGKPVLDGARWIVEARRDER